MDFTYYIAGLIAVVVGFVAGIVFIILKGRSKRRLFAIAVGIAVVLDVVLLINWARIGQEPGDTIIILVDFVFFSIYSIIGCIIGALPALLARYVWRRRSGHGARASI